MLVLASCRFDEGGRNIQKEMFLKLRNETEKLTKKFIEMLINKIQYLSNNHSAI